MQIENELKEILLELYTQACADGKYDRCVPLSVIIDNYTNKILALGKPEPLEKNKQTQEFFCQWYEDKQTECDGMNYQCNECSKIEKRTV